MSRTQSIAIRPYQPADWPAVWKVLRPVLRAGESYAVPADVSESDARALWTDVPRSVFVAIDTTTAEVVGTYYLKANHSGPDAHACNCGYVVAEKVRGRGIASRMCEHSQRQALSKGFRAMHYDMVAASNEGAVRLWRSHGFDVVATLPGAFAHPTLGPVDAYVMYKQLVAGARGSALEGGRPTAGQAMRAAGEKVDLAAAFATFDEPWSPRVVAELNGQQVKLAKFEGEFLWHRHDAADELFLVVRGHLSIHLRDRLVELSEGQFFVVPRGTEHKPVAPQGAEVLLFEPAATVNTGDGPRVDATIEAPQWLSQAGAAAPGSEGSDDPAA